MTWLIAVFVGGLVTTIAVIFRHGGKRFFLAPFVMENITMTMVAGGLVFGTASWGLLKLFH